MKIVIAGWIDTKRRQPLLKAWADERDGRELLGLRWGPLGLTAHPRCSGLLIARIGWDTGTRTGNFEDGEAAAVVADDAGVVRAVVGWESLAETALPGYVGRAADAVDRHAMDMADRLIARARGAADKAELDLLFSAMSVLAVPRRYRPMVVEALREREDALLASSS